MDTTLRVSTSLRGTAIAKESIPESERAKDAVNLEMERLPTHSALGLKWNINDELVSGQRSRNMAVRFYLAPVTFLLSAVLLRSWLLYCSGFDNDQTTRSLFETNVTKRPLEIGLEAFHRISRSTRSNAILDHSKSSIILMLKFLLLQCGDIQVNPGPPKHPCGLCYKAVRSNQKAIECEECLRWFHINCTAMSAQSYDNFGRNSNLV